MAHPTRHLEYDLYLDESGTFLENSSEPKRDEQTDKKKRSFPSQFAGFLVPRRDIYEDAARIIEECKRAARVLPYEKFKGSVFFGRRFARIISRLADELRKQREWQPMRLVNEEAVAYGNQIAAYTNILAELVLRIFQDLSKSDRHTKFSLRIFCTRLMMDGRTPLKDEEYQRRIREYLAFVSVRHGLARESSNWIIDGVKLNAGRERPELLICDLLSNASHNRYEKLRREKLVLKKLKDAFGNCDLTMVVRELIERVDHLAEECSYGIALMALAEGLTEPSGSIEEDGDLREQARQRLAHILKRLTRIGERGRDPQLAVLVNWLDQIIGQQRLPERGYQLARWLIEHVATPLHQQLEIIGEENTVVWFAYALHRWALTAANYQGALVASEAEAQAMKRLQPLLGRQWERAALLMEGLVVQAVHQIDCFEYEKASANMQIISRSLQTQSDLFHEYMPEDFPERLRFDLRAKALGTLVQSETFAGLQNADRLHRAREISDEAIREFSSPGDKSRQYQYRCQLEMVANDFANARSYLIKSLRPHVQELPDTSHARIKDLIIKSKIDPEWKEEFTISHWLRLGANICLYGSSTEREAFLNSLDASHVLNSELCLGKSSSYPVHSILRSVAVIQASRGKKDEALAALVRLHEIEPINEGRLVLGMILLAAQTEVAALLWDSAQARQLLDNAEAQPLGIKQLLQLMEEKGAKLLPRIWEILKPWSGKVESLLTTERPSPNSVRVELLSLARLVGQ